MAAIRRFCLVCVSVFIAAAASAQHLTEFPVVTASGLPSDSVGGIVAGPDGALWFTEAGPTIGRLTTAGALTEFTIPSGQASTITRGPDGALWFVEETANKIGRITTAGTITEFPVPTANSHPFDIATGPDGALWFTEFVGQQIGRITTTGAITEFPLASASTYPEGIALGPDGNLWIVETGLNSIGRMTTSGVVTDFPILTPSSGSWNIVAGPDGALWFNEYGSSRIGRVTTAGTVTEFPAPDSVATLLGLAAGPDGNVWFASSNGNHADAIVRMTPAGTATEFPTSAGAYPVGLTAYSGALWFTEWDGGAIGRLSVADAWPLSLHVDGAPASGSFSNANGVLEPGETAVIRPTWRNDLLSVGSFDGIATSPSGPPGAVYLFPDDSAQYPGLAAGASEDCGSNCYLFSVTNPSTRPALHWDASFTEMLDATGAIKTWTVHVGSTFPDVAITSPFYRFIETLVHNSVTAGCGGGAYCPTATTSRQQMAVFALVSKQGAGYAPPACGAPVFADVPASSPFCKWIEELARRGVVSGCGAGNYCPTADVTRQQMAVFALVTLQGSGYAPPACGTPMFGDVPASSGFCKWIEELARRGVVTGCGGGNYCPTAPVTRAQMSVFLTGTFGLSLYGP